MQILEAESCNLKALYRRAQAYMGVAELLLAEVDINKALEVDPQNRYLFATKIWFSNVDAPFKILFQWLIFREVKLLEKKFKQLKAESNKRDGRLYKAMFSSKSDDVCTAEKVSCCLS